MPPENNHPNADQLDLVSAVEQCARSGEFMQSILNVYENLEQARTPKDAICLGGGACCRFDLFDHRLYATVGELALLQRAEPADISRLTMNRCPYQKGPKCLARENRPLGCRIFFCREKHDISDPDAYEMPHNRISELHQRHNLPYAYVELISTLKLLHEFSR